MQHKMTHIGVHGAGVDSEQFRDTVDRHLESMSMSGWELVSTDVNETSGLRSGLSVDALFFWRKPD